MSLAIKFWGVRGSLPSPHVPFDLNKRIERIIIGFLENGYTRKEQVRSYIESLPAHESGGFGGNTTCVEVITQDDSIVIDAGTGLRLLGYSLMTGPCGRGQGEVHIFMTHFHWDHIMGLPFFLPMFVPGNNIHFHAVQPELETILNTLFHKPFFPVHIDDIKATLHYHKLAPREPISIGCIEISPYKLDHPDPCWGYKIRSENRAISFCVDTECTRVSRDELNEDLPLYQDTDLMVFDSQYTLDQIVEKANWGHSAATIGLDIALREKIKRVAFTHHDPGATDEAIAQSIEQTRIYYEQAFKNILRTNPQHPGVNWSFVQEGTLIHL